MKQRFPELRTAAAVPGRASRLSIDDLKEDTLSTEFLWKTEGRDGKDIRRNGRM